MKKKLVLTYPNLKWQKTDLHTMWNLNPNTLCLLGKMVENEVDVKIIDAQFYDLSVDEFTQQILDYGADYVGISILTSEYSQILHIAAEAIKEANPDIVVIAGGVHVIIEYKQVIADPNIDYAVRGEGEYVLGNLLRYLNGDEELGEEGIVYREGNDIKIGSHAFVSDLTKLPHPDYNLVNMNDYVMKAARYGPQMPPEAPHVRMGVTRGCPVGCSFCQVESIAGKPVRARDPDDIVDELEYLKKNYGIKSLIFDDDNISLKKKFFKQMLRRFIERELNLKFIVGSFAIFALDDEMLDLMAKAGCQGINVSIESGNQRVMKDIVQKPIRLTTVPPLIKKITDTGMYVYANFIIGFPGETWTEIRETINFAESCGADYVKIFIAVPLKETKMWNIGKQLGVLHAVEENYSPDWRFGKISSDEWTAKDITILRAYEWDRINFATPKKRKRMVDLWEMTEEQLFDIRKKTRDAVTLESAGENLLIN